MGDLDNNIFFFLQKCHTYSRLKKKFTLLNTNRPFFCNIEILKHPKYIQILIQIYFVFSVTQRKRNFFITITGISF